MSKWEELKETVESAEENGEALPPFVVRMWMEDLESAEVKDAPDSCGDWWAWNGDRWFHVWVTSSILCSKWKAKHWVKADKPTFPPKEEISDEPPPKEESEPMGSSELDKNDNAELCRIFNDWEVYPPAACREEVRELISKVRHETAGWGAR